MGNFVSNSDEGFGGFMNMITGSIAVLRQFSCNAGYAVFGGCINVFDSSSLTCYHCMFEQSVATFSEQSNVIIAKVSQGGAGKMFVILHS